MEKVTINDLRFLSKYSAERFEHYVSFRISALDRAFSFDATRIENGPRALNESSFDGDANIFEPDALNYLLTLVRSFLVDEENARLDEIQDEAERRNAAMITTGFNDAAMSFIERGGRY